MSNSYTSNNKLNIATLVNSNVNSMNIAMLIAMDNSAIMSSCTSNLTNYATVNPPITSVLID